MTSPNLTAGARASTIKSLAYVLSDLKSFHDEFTKTQLEIIRRDATKIAEICSLDPHRNMIDEHDSHGAGT